MVEAVKMKVRFPGLCEERLPSGGMRYRVRVEGRPHKKIRMHCAPGERGFEECYHAARRGIEIKPETPPEDTRIKHSLGWLITLYLADLEKSGNPATHRQRKSLLGRLDAQYGEFRLDMPQAEVIGIRDAMRATPGAADNMVKSIRALYRWAMDRDIADANPAVGIARINRDGTGAAPWTIDDLRRYRAKHPAGTSAHLCLTLFMFTACRISDAIILGRSHEIERDGVRGLAWQPAKSGSARVEIPMLPPLFEATRRATVIGPTYMLTEYGTPFQSPEGLRNRFRNWCDTADLKDRSSHGIRKAAGNLLAEYGCTQHEIMAVHGHTQAKTSEIYTKGAERWRLAANAMQRLQGLEW